jgi:large subunit ribosomal protein L16
LLLRPRKFTYKNIQKRRSLNKLVNKKLTYGNVGLLLTQPLRVNSRQIFRYKLFLKKASRKKDKTLRMLWFNAFPHLPVTRKVLGSRMGKGKGKLDD